MVHALAETDTGQVWNDVYEPAVVTRLSEQQGMIARVSCMGDLATGTAQRDLVRILQDVGFRNVAADGSWSDWNKDVRVRIEVDGQTGLVQQVFIEIVNPADLRQ